MSYRYLRIAALMAGSLMLSGLSGCGGGSSGTGTLDLSVTDTPVDGAQSVVVAFTGVELMGPSGLQKYPLSSEQTIDLLKLQGNASASLLDGVAVPAGNYQWIRLDIDDANSYLIDSNGGKFPLDIPSGSQSGLKLVSGFTVAQGGTADFMIDFDLRQSVTLDNSGGMTTYTLKPALRLINMEQVGSVSGTVASTLSVGGLLITDTACSPAVYVYQGTGIVPQGYNVTVTGGTAPLTSATVALDTNTGAYAYTVGFLAPGSYTLAVTCAATDKAGATTLAFSTAQTATVTANSTTTINF
ncbi:MAG: DUF4382 domain-containing protein [Bacillota bacterium]